MPEVSMRVQEGSVLVLNGSLSSMAESQQIVYTAVIPRILIEEQPASVFRFRYQSEHGSHGSLMGESSSKGRKTCPKIRIENYYGRVKLRVSLYTYKDEETNGPGSPGTPVQHVHMLHGKNCDKDRGFCEVEVDVPPEGRSVEFPNLYISHVAKRSIPSILHERYRQDHMNDVAALVKLGWGNEQYDIDEETNNNLKQKAESDAKNMEKKLNSVVLCFEAEIFIQNSWVRCCDPVFSSPINNQKAAATGSLKICRIDRAAGSIKGGDEVFILCEKVDKKNIKVRFYQQDDDWEDFGNFTEFDVHHQYAIVFKTPSYKDTSLGEDVHVKIELYRPSDGAASNSVDFTYTPDDDYDLRRKKRKKIESSSQGFRDTSTSSCMQEPSAGFMDKKPSNLQLSYANPSYGSSSGTSAAGCQQVPNTSDILDEVLELGQTNPFLRMTSSFHDGGCVSIPPPVYKESDPMIGQITPELQTLMEEFEGKQPLCFPGEKDVMLPNLNNQNNTLDSYLGTVAAGDYLAPENSTGAEMISRGSFSDYDDLLVPDGISSANRSSTKQTAKIEQKAVPVGRPTPASASKQGQNGEKMSENELVYRLALQTAKKLRDYARTSDIQHLLGTMRHLTAVPDDNGDNAIHLAAIHSQDDAILQMVKVADSDPINAFNELIQTPLHIAVHVNSPSIVEALIQNGADINLLDRHGNSALHTASKHGKPKVVRVIVNKENYFKNSVETFPILDALNYSGYAPLHLAVQAGSLDSVRELCLARCNVNVEDGTSGRTALHIAIENKYEEILKFLLTQESINVDCQAFNGYTPLHLACSMNLEPMVKLLRSYDADPYIETCEPVQEQLSSDEETTTPDTSGAKPNFDEAEELNRGCNSFDIAKDNENILQLLHEVCVDVTTCPPLTVAPEQPKEAVPLNSRKLSDSGVCVDSGFLEIRKTSHDLIDEPTRNQLATLLDGSDEKNWRELSKRLDLSHLDYVFESSKSPTLVMLQYIDSVPDLRDSLAAMEHEEAVSLLENLSSEQEVGEQCRSFTGMTAIPQQDLSKQMAKMKINP